MLSRRTILSNMDNFPTTASDENRFPRALASNDTGISGGDGSGGLAQIFLINFVLLVAMIIGTVYLVGRRKRRKRTCLRLRESPVALFKSCWRFYIIRRLKEPSLHPDASLYLRLLWDLFLVLLIASVLGVGVILPVNVAKGSTNTFTGEEEQNFAATTVNNLPENSPAYWTHAVFDVVFSVVLGYVIVVQSWRIDKLTYAEDYKAPYGTAVLISKISKKVDRYTLRSYLRALGLGNVSVLRIRNKAKLIQLYEDWTKKADALERALILTGVPPAVAEKEACAPSIDLSLDVPTSGWKERLKIPGLKSKHTRTTSTTTTTETTITETTVQHLEEGSGEHPPSLSEPRPSAPGTFAGPKNTIQLYRSRNIVIRHRFAAYKKLRKHHRPSFTSVEKSGGEEKRANTEDEEDGADVETVPQRRSSDTGKELLSPTVGGASGLDGDTPVVTDAGDVGNLPGRLRYSKHRALRYAAKRKTAVPWCQRICPGGLVCCNPILCLTYGLCWRNPSRMAAEVAKRRIEEHKAAKLLEEQFRQSERPMTNRAIVIFSSATAAKSFLYLINHKKKTLVEHDTTDLAGLVKVRKWQAVPSPDPRSINWIRICLPETTRAFKSFLVNVALIMFILFFTTPTALLTAVEGQSQESFGGGVNDTWRSVVEFLRDLSPFLTSLLLEYLPTLLLVLANAVILLIINIASRKLNPHIWEAGQESDIMGLSFGYLFFNTVIVPTFVLTSAFAFVQAVIRDNDLLTVLGQLFLADSGTLFVGFLLQAGLLGGGFLLLRLPEVLKRCCFSTRAVTSTDYKKVAEIKVFDFGERYAQLITAFAVAFVFSVMIPLIIPTGALLIIIQLAIDKFNFWYAYHELYVAPEEDEVEEEEGSHHSNRSAISEKQTAFITGPMSSSSSEVVVQRPENSGNGDGPSVAQAASKKAASLLNAKDVTASPGSAATYTAEDGRSSHGGTGLSHDTSRPTPLTVGDLHIQPPVANAKAVGALLGRSAEKAATHQFTPTNATSRARLEDAAGEGRMTEEYAATLRYYEKNQEPTYRGETAKKALHLLTIVLFIFQVRPHRVAYGVGRVIHSVFSNLNR